MFNQNYGNIIQINSIEKISRITKVIQKNREQKFNQQIKFKNPSSEFFEILQVIEEKNNEHQQI